MLETAQKYKLSFSEHAEGSMLAETVFNFHALAYARACRKVNISWDGLRFWCIRLCRRLLKSMSYLFSENTETLILAETVFDFYALAYGGDCSKVWVILSQSMQKAWYSPRRSSISMHQLMPETAEKYELSFLLSLIHISEPTRLGMISYAVFCLKKKKDSNKIR